MKSPRSIWHHRNKRHLLPPRLAKKHVRIVYFQPIARRLPNGLPNLTGVLAVAACRLGRFHIQAELRLLNKTGQPGVKIVSVYDLARRKRAYLEVSDHLLASLRVKMITQYVRTQAERYVEGEGHK